MKLWVDKLLYWYEKSKRDLPWRKRKDPYSIWISEIMLQQTKVDTVIDYYNRFLEKFPTVEDLSNADLDEVLKMWEGLGYYSRAKNIHKAANKIVTEYKGNFPNTYEEIISLPGIGEYTAGAILGIAYNKPYPAIDGNVLRVMARVLLIQKDITDKNVKKEIHENLIAVFPQNRASDFNQSLMELGALICIPKSPKCLLCPIYEECEGFKNNMQAILPIKKKKEKQKKVTRYIGIIKKEGYILMNKRPSNGLLGDLWEFPGVDCDDEKEFTENFKKKYGIDILKIKYDRDAKHIFTHIIWEMKVYHCTIMEIKENRKEGLSWIKIEDLDCITIPSAFQTIKESIFL